MNDAPPRNGSGLIYYMRDGLAAFRFRLAGDLSRDGAADLGQARQAASSVFGGRPLVGDLTGIESIDTAGCELLDKWHGLGAQFVVTAHEAKVRIQSMTGVPVSLLEKTSGSFQRSGRAGMVAGSRVRRVVRDSCRHYTPQPRFLQGRTETLGYSIHGAWAMKSFELETQGAADLHWLATLLTGCRKMAVDVIKDAIAPADDSNSFFGNWMLAWSRRLVIAQALTVVRDNLAKSARRTASTRARRSQLTPRSWTLYPETTKSDVERALLSIDVFPRAAILLLVFERVPLQDTAILLDSDRELVHKAQVLGLRELTINLARMQGWKSTVSKSNTVISELQHA